MALMNKQTAKVEAHQSHGRKETRICGRILDVLLELLSKLTYLEDCFDNHEVLVGGSQDPFSVKGDIYGCDGRSQAWDGSVCSGQRFVAVEPDLAVIRSNHYVAIPYTRKQTYCNTLLISRCLSLVLLEIALPSNGKNRLVRLACCPFSTQNVAKSSNVRVVEILVEGGGRRGGGYLRWPCN